MKMTFGFAAAQAPRAKLNANSAARKRELISRNWLFCLVGDSLSPSFRSEGRLHAFGFFSLQEPPELLHFLGKFRGQVFCFAGIIGQIIELRSWIVPGFRVGEFSPFGAGTLWDEFPITQAHGQPAGMLHQVTPACFR